MTKTKFRLQHTISTIIWTAIWGVQGFIILILIGYLISSLV